MQAKLQVARGRKIGTSTTVSAPQHALPLARVITREAGALASTLEFMRKRRGPRFFLIEKFLGDLK
jgi:hypothetical protein